MWLLFTDKETPFQLSHAHMATQQGEGRTLALFPSGNTPEATLEHNYLAFFQAYSDASIRGQFTFLPLPLLSIPSSFLSFLAGESLIYSCISLGIPVTLIHLPPSQLTWKYHQSALGVYRKDGAGSLCTLACKECAEKTTCGECDSNSSSPHLHPDTNQTLGPRTWRREGSTAFSRDAYQSNTASLILSPPRPPLSP